MIAPLTHLFNWRVKKVPSLAHPILRLAPRQDWRSRRRAIRLRVSVTMVAVTTFAEFQEMIEATYGTRDRARGQAATVAWLCEEVGELAKAARKGTREEQLHELSDVVAWVASLANQLDLSIEEALTRYAKGCPRCQITPCKCP
jgi:NTP pyrophosphatase (non-canonical NTP hydrolase)